MAITMNDLTISPEGINREDLLSDWTWAMEEPMLPVLLTALGDVFAQGESGAIYFVNVIEGRINRVADDSAAFQNLLTDTEFVTEHMFPSRIVHFRAAGKTLSPKHVYSYKQPLVLGGEDDVDNIEPTFASVHISLHGQIHEQVKDLPEGTPIGELKIRDPQ